MRWGDSKTQSNLGPVSTFTLGDTAGNHVSGAQGLRQPVVQREALNERLRVTLRDTHALHVDTGRRLDRAGLLDQPPFAVSAGDMVQERVSDRLHVRLPAADRDNLKLQRVERNLQVFTIVGPGNQSHDGTGGIDPVASYLVALYTVETRARIHRLYQQYVTTMMREKRGIIETDDAGDTSRHGEQVSLA